MGGVKKGLVVFGQTPEIRTENVDKKDDGRASPQAFGISETPIHQPKLVDIGNMET